MIILREIIRKIVKEEMIKNIGDEIKPIRDKLEKEHTKYFKLFKQDIENLMEKKIIEILDKRGIK